MISNKCKICDNSIIKFLEFNMPLAGLFLENQNDEATSYPLSLCFCEHCGLVQVDEEIDPNVLFNNYMYKTGTIETLKKHFDSFANKLNQDYKFDTILEIGCNDLTFLKNFEDKTSIGVDPSDVAKLASEDNHNINLYNTFFSAELAETIVDKYPIIDIVYASNCFAHIPTIKNIVAGIKKLLTTKNSTFIVEVHWLGTLIKDLQFPFIYHEHVFYYSYKSIAYLLGLYDIEIFNVEHIDTHGGSIRYYCALKNTNNINSSVKDLIEEEESLKLYDIETFINLADRIYQIKQSINNTVDDILKTNKTLAAYGASGQAQTFLSICELDNSKINYIVDDSPLKINRFTSSGKLPIKSSNVLYNNTPDYILCLAYTFFKEIINKHDKLKTKWIIPLPNYQIIDNT